MKRRTLLISGFLILFVFLGIGTAYAAISRSQQTQQQDNQDTGKDTDHEVLIHNPQSTSGSCGVERWAVKTGTDANVGLISLQSITQTTIASLSALPPPATLPASTRIQPTETTVFQLHDTLTQYKLENDSDYHLIVADTSGKTMIVEIPDPACVGASSPLLSDIQKARA
nr:hypothetical protein [Ktedonobacteraceae bacterium]